MDSETIARLANLTTSFYQKTASDFSQSRSQPWEGWESLISVINKISAIPIRVLDVACGNGRFIHFLSQKFPEKKFEYTGVDNNLALLRDAKNQSTGQNLVSQLVSLDIIEKLLQKNNFLRAEEQFDLLVAFGIMHHIPSQELREQFFRTLSAHSKPGGIVIVTFWDFIAPKRLEKKQIDPALLGIDKKLLDSGDYILDWKRGTSAFRYANHITVTQRYHLAKTVGFSLLTEFRADGKEKNLNHYLVLQK